MGGPAELLVVCKKRCFVSRAGDNLARLRAGRARCSAFTQAGIQGTAGEHLALGRITVSVEAGLPEPLSLLLTIHGACLRSEPAAIVAAAYAYLFRAHHADVGTRHLLREEEKKRRDGDAGRRQGGSPWR